MINIYNNPSLLAIFLTKSQIELWESYIESSLISSFQERLLTLFAGVPVYLNYPLQIQNSHLLQITSEKEFLYEVSKNLPPSKSSDSDFDEIYLAYFYGVYPLLSIQSTTTLIERHTKYISQYSYSENLPPGIVPTLISREFVSTIPDKLDMSFHDFLLKNINQYDTEIYFESPDLRNLRLDFTLNTYRSLKITSELLLNNSNLEYSEILPLLKNNTNLLRTSPSYIEMEIFRGCEYSCTFCPRSNISKDRDGSFITLNQLKDVITNLSVFKETYTICLGGMGEPFLHPHLIQLVDEILNENMVKELIIETALYKDLNNFITYLQNLSLEKKSKLTLIINLTTLKDSTYKDIYGEDKLQNILNNITLIQSNLPKRSLYVQILKIKEVENEIEEYFNYFERLDIQVLLQKYNSYAHKLEEKRVSDLTPIQRDFCWHLSRDLYIQSNGDVSACKQDESTIIGNINSHSILEIWNQNNERFRKSFHQNHKDIDLPCLNCDEWYTFNA